MDGSNLVERNPYDYKHRTEKLSFADIAFQGVSLAVTDSSGSAAAFDRARQWLSHCLDSHPECRAAGHQGQNLTGPRRLLNVTAACSHGLQLVDFDGSAARPKYACLSYCRGDDLEGVLATTRQNVDEHLLGICQERLPSAITDAIRVCRELGIQYLWVDSLCILQQDDVDFAVEGSKMDTIYANSLLTIYAKHTNSCKDGFLGPQLYGQPEWQYLAPFPSAPKGLPFLIRKGGHDSTPFPLDSRGWCLQESLLPSRQLLYTGEEMVWRCSTRGLCECGHLAGHELDVGGWQHFDDRYVSHFFKTARSIPDQHTRPWGKTIEEYSERLLTNPQDKLAAISGLAGRRLHSSSAPNDRYVAGLFTEGLPGQLLWRLNYYKRESDRSGHHDRDIIYGQRLLNGTPTWSWASVEGVLEFIDTLETPQAGTTAHIDSISCVPCHTENPLGPVKSGLLVLTAPVLAVRLAFQNTPASFGRPGVTLVSPTHGSCPLRTTLVSLDIEQTVHDGVEYCRRIPQDALPPTQDGCTCNRRLSSKPYVACGIGLDRRYNPWGAEIKDCIMDFLLLEETSDEGTYRRVGLVSGKMLRMVDAAGPVVAGAGGAQKLFWETLPPFEPSWDSLHKPGIRPLLKGQARIAPWPARVEVEWKQVRIV